MRSSDQQKDVLQKIIDPQIYTSKHDEITMWLYGELKNNFKYTNAFLMKFGLNDFNPDDWKIRSLVALEKPLIKKTYRSENIQGFIDVYFEFEAFHKTLKNPDNHPKWFGFSSYIEVKSSVNVGETIRQVNYYKNIVGSDSYRTKFCVCAPSFDGSDIFADQDIIFIPYKPT